MLADAILWRCFGKSNEVIHLLGTAHVYEEKYIIALERLTPILQQSDFFLAEVSLEQIGGLDSIPNSILSTEKFPYSHKKKISFQKALLKNFGLRFPDITVQSPFVIVQSVQQSILPSDSEVFGDLYLWNVAQSLGLVCRGMETLDSQHHLMQVLAIQTSWKEVKRIAENPSRYRKEMREMLYDYENRRLTALYKKSRKSLGNMKRTLLLDRNQTMFNAIISHAMKGKVFAAMGAAHLAGNYGLLALLKRGGFKCKPLDFSIEDCSLSNAG